MSAADAVELRAWEGRDIAAWQRAWNVPELHVLARTGSTNDLAKAAAATVPTGCTYIADVQTAGRGQHGRHWESQPGASLLMSVVLRARPGAPALGAAPLRVGLAVANALETALDAQVAQAAHTDERPDAHTDEHPAAHTDVAQAAVALKWPNDVLIDGRKVAGILCEGVVAANGSVVIAGIGINVLQRPDDFSPDVAPHATSLSIVTGRSIARAELAGLVLRALQPARDVMGEPLGADDLRAFAARDALCGHAITVDGEFAGVADGVSPDGALRVQHDGWTRMVRSGTVRIAGAPGAAHERAQ